MDEFKESFDELDPAIQLFHFGADCIIMGNLNADLGYLDGFS